MRVVQIIADERDVLGVDASEPFFGSAPTALLEGFALFPNEVEVHVVSCVRRPLSAPQKLADNIFYHAVPINGGYRRTLFAKAVTHVRETIRRIDPVAVHGQGTEDYQGVCAAFSGYPNCITIHGNMRAVVRRLGYKPFPSMAITAMAESVALRKTDAVACNSAYTEQCVGRLNKKQVLIPNAVRSSFFDLAAHRTTHNSQPTTHSSPALLCIGHILPYKNQIGLMRALDPLAALMPFRLVFVGKCRSDDEYGRRFLDEVSSRSWCEHAGRLDIRELQVLVCQCSGVIHPTLEDSFGLAVAEAQAAGVPVAASAIGGLPDLIRHGETGLLFNPTDSEDIRQKVAALLDPSVATDLAHNARKFADAEYRPEVIACKHIEFYERLLKELV
jgi:glycosyltransferase involved in cell wall biosynthesis